jgi:hypothetical protein
MVIVAGSVPPLVTLSDMPPAKVNPTLVELPISTAHEAVQLVVIAR